MFWKMRYHKKVLKGELLQKILNGETPQKILNGKITKKVLKGSELWNTMHSKVLKGEIQYYKHVLNGEIPQKSSINL